MSDELTPPDDAPDPLTCRRPVPRPMLEVDCPDLSVRLAMLERDEWISSYWDQIVTGMRAQRVDGEFWLPVEERPAVLSEGRLKYFVRHCPFTVYGQLGVDRQLRYVGITAGDGFLTASQKWSHGNNNRRGDRHGRGVLNFSTELRRRAMERWEYDYGRMLPTRYEDGRLIDYDRPLEPASPPFVLFAVGLPMVWGYALEGRLIETRRPPWNTAGATPPDKVRWMAANNKGAVEKSTGLGFWEGGR